MSAIARPVADFATLLRQQRRARRLSQLDLALQAQVSQRHVSFLESGRARPSRDMVLQLAGVLDLPLDDRNHWLHAAGFAGLYPRREMEAVDMAPIRAALQLLLHHHEPLPAIVVDRQWNVLMSNRAMDRVLNLPGDAEARWRRVCGDGPPNILKLSLHPDGLQPYIRNFSEIAAALLARTTREAQDHPEVAEILRIVSTYPGLPARRHGSDALTDALPVLPTHLEFNGMSLRLFSMLSTFGTPLDVTTDRLRVEQFFPADAASEALLQALAASP